MTFLLFVNLKEPYHWPSVTAISKKVLGIRYSLLPYYYTLFYKAHRNVDSGNPPAATVVRPLFFEFPADANTYPIDWQFMLGSILLISPVLRVGMFSHDIFIYFLCMACDHPLMEVIVMCYFLAYILDLML